MVDHNIHPVKYFLMMFCYLWLRFDPVLRIGFGNNWRARYDFLAQLFGGEDAQKFLAHRGELIELRNRPQTPIILPSEVAKQTKRFLQLKVTKRSDRKERLEIIKRLIFWATDKDINGENVDSFRTRSAIIGALLDVIFHNSLYEESELILSNLKLIVFSRVTYLGSKGEPSPVVHNVILSGVSQLLMRHFSEIVRLRDQRVDKLTTVQIIKELNKGRGDTGSLAFSGEIKFLDEYRHKFPLSGHHARLLYEILDHYRFSAWPDSRDQARRVIAELEGQLKTSLKHAIELTKD